MPKIGAVKCYFECALNGGPVHCFPHPHYPYMDKFNQWKSVLDSATQAKGDAYISRTVRLCDRHFESYYITSSRRLVSIAVPTLNLKNVQSELNDSSKEQIVEPSALGPSQDLETQAVSSSEEEEEEDDPGRHEGVICDNCTNPIFEFRYKCVTCDNYDLCQKCEMLKVHSEHYMLRISKSLEFKLADNLMQKLKSFFNSKHTTPEGKNVSSNCDKVESVVSSDDEPVTKSTRCDNGTDLSEDVKEIMRNEVDRALKAVREKQKKKAKHKSTSSTKAPEDVPIKKLRTKDNIETDQETQDVPELALADVNAAKYGRSYGKRSKATKTTNNSVIPAETPSVDASSKGTDTVAAPMYFLKISNDLSQLFLEVAPNVTNNLNKLQKPQD